jgi:hypothetical protein
LVAAERVGCEETAEDRQGKQLEFSMVEEVCGGGRAAEDDSCFIAIWGISASEVFWVDAEKTPAEDSSRQQAAGTKKHETG